MAPVCKDMRSMPYSQVSEKVMTGIVDNRNEEYHGTIISSNNDFLADINPDIQLAQSAIQNQCKQYNFDEFSNSFSNLQNFLSMIHVNIRSSQKNLMDFICNLENLNVQFHFIVLSETWGTHDKAKLNITQGYNHLYDTREQRNGGGISIYGCRPDERNLRSGIFKTELCIPLSSQSTCESVLIILKKN